MNRGKCTGAGDQGGREVLTVLLVVLLGGLTLIAATDRLLHVRPTRGDSLCAALPLLAAAAAQGSS